MRRLRPAPFFLLLLLFLPAGLRAQRELSGFARIQSALARLNVTGSVLMIAAHPDDENTELLAYFARGLHLRTAYLSLTRGEGGQNLIGPEQGEVLGVIRTQELLQARRIDGAEQYFTRAIDFGYSKSADEALAKWGHEKVLSDVVWVIRKFRPDVIVLRFSGTPRDGHGQHQASAILGREAFEAAADPKRFPEQLKYVSPWRAKRVVWNTFAFTRQQQEESEKMPQRIVIDTGKYDPILGYSYSEIAGMSRSAHSSQAMGVPQPKGTRRSIVVPVAGDAARQNLFDDIDLTWKRVPGGEAVGSILAEAQRRLEPETPENVVPLLLQARQKAAAINDPIAKRKLAEIDEAIALCMGLWLDASADRATVVHGGQVQINLNVVNRSRLPARLTSVRVNGEADGSGPTLLEYNQPVTKRITVKLDPDEPVTQPYWLRLRPAGAMYRVTDQKLIGLPESPPALRARFALEIHGQQLEFERPVQHRYINLARGELTRPLEVVPPVALELPSGAMLFPEAKPRRITVRVRGNAPASGELRLDLPSGWKSEPARQPFHFASAGEQAAVEFQVSPPAARTREEVKAVATVNGREVASGMQTIEYPHIPPQMLFPAARVPVVRVDVQTSARSVGYIMGAGDGVLEALRQMGCAVTLIDSEMMARGDLSRFDAIVMGVRAQSVRPDVRANRQRLLDYVSKGGTLVVQYNRLEQNFGPEDTIAPYPITIGTARVSVEEAPVAFPNPSHPVLQKPNRIVAADFDGWVQERGLYFATRWDPRYEVLFTSHDPGEPPQGGGALFTRYGKGAYVFTAYAWFRQLPEGVPGAYRIFANLISAGKTISNASSSHTH